MSLQTDPHFGPLCQIRRKNSGHDAGRTCIRGEMQPQDSVVCQAECENQRFTDWPAVCFPAAESRLRCKLCGRKTGRGCQVNEHEVACDAGSQFQSVHDKTIKPEFGGQSSQPGGKKLKKIIRRQRERRRCGLRIGSRLKFGHAQKRRGLQTEIGDLDAVFHQRTPVYCQRETFTPEPYAVCIAQFDAVYAEGKGKVTVQIFQTEREPHRNKGRLQGTVQMSENPSFSLVCAGKHTGRGKKQNGKQRQRQDYRQQTEEQPPDAAGAVFFFLCPAFFVRAFFSRHGSCSRYA